MDLENIKAYLENEGVCCSIKRKVNKDRSIDYQFILCYYGGITFEVKLWGDAVVFTTIRDGLLYTYSRMFSEFELRMACNINIVEYCVVEMLHRFIHDTNKHIV